MAERPEDDLDDAPDDGADDSADDADDSADDDPRHAPYLVQLLTAQAPQLDGAALLARLSQRCGHVLAMGDFSEDLLSYAFDDHRTVYADGPMAAMCMVTPSERLPPAADLEASAQQTWDWEGARPALAAARHSLVVSDFCANGLPRSERLELFGGLVASVLELVPCLAIQWVPSRKLVDPQAFARAPDLLQAAINVRVHKIADRRPGELVMDTLGLAPFGLPDVQMHLVPSGPLSAAAVAHFLAGVARYVFERGPVIESGHSLPGPSGERLLCRLEKALVDPDRPVLDIDPGPPYSARLARVPG